MDEHLPKPATPKLQKKDIRPTVVSSKFIQNKSFFVVLCDLCGLCVKPQVRAGQSLRLPQEADVSGSPMFSLNAERTEVAENHRESAAVRGDGSSPVARTDPLGLRDPASCSRISACTRTTPAKMAGHRLPHPHRHSFKGFGRVTLVSRTGTLRGVVAPLDAAPVCRSATDSTLLQTLPESRLHPGRQLPPPRINVAPDRSPGSSVWSLCGRILHLPDSSVLGARSLAA
jgi:hypothetical protein